MKKFRYVLLAVFTLCAMFAVVKVARPQKTPITAEGLKNRDLQVTVDLTAKVTPASTSSVTSLVGGRVNDCLLYTSRFFRL